MASSNKLEIFEDNQGMDIALTWYSPKAFFFLFFTIAWNAFLVFWYTMAIGMDAPWIFKIFPIIHVAVGVYLLYYTFCLFFNKTYIHLYENQLSVLHQPIPWWKGNKNLNSHDIDQLYVHEKVKTNSDNGSKTYTYELRAKMKDQKIITLLGLEGVNSGQIQEIEERLESFLGIEDQPVKGEFGANKKGYHKDRPRRHRRQFVDEMLSGIYFSKQHEELTLKNEILKIITINQYDWKDGNSDKLFQLYGEEQQETKLYVRQDKALLKIYEEQALSSGIVMDLNFNITKVPTIIELGEKQFTLEQHLEGKRFSTLTNNSIEVQQWIYHSKDKNTYIRIVDQNGQVNAFSGNLLSKSDFRMSITPQEEEKVKLKDKNDPNYKDRDLV